MIDKDVAKPLRMLSAYLITAAMTRPPMAFIFIDLLIYFLCIINKKNFFPQIED